MKGLSVGNGCGSRMLELLVGAPRPPSYTVVDAMLCGARTALLFDKVNFFEPLAEGRDVLEGRHANTHLAQVG